MFALTLAANATNYASNLIFGRLLTPASYGELTALLSLTVILAVPAGAAQIVVADKLAEMTAAGRGDRVNWLARYASGHIIVISIAVGVVYGACIPLLIELLDLQAPGPAIAALPLLVTTLLLPVAYGFLQGLERFYALGVATLGVAAGRVVFGVPWASAGGGAGGALAGQAIATAVVVVAITWLLRDRLKRDGTGAGRAGALRRPDSRALLASGAFIAFALLSNLDVLLAKAILSPDESGQYAALATIGKMILFLPTAIALVMVPNAARARQGGDQAAVLRVAGLITAGVGILVVIPAALEPSLLLKLMFGNEYTDAASGVLPMALAGAGLGVINLLVIYTVAMQDRRWPLLLLAGIALQIPAILLLGESPTQIATVQCLVVFVVLVVNELVFHPILRAERMVRQSS